MERTCRSIEGIANVHPRGGVSQQLTPRRSVLNQHICLVGTVGRRRGQRVPGSRRRGAITCRRRLGRGTCREGSNDSHQSGDLTLHANKDRSAIRTIEPVNGSAPSRSSMTCRMTPSALKRAVIRKRGSHSPDRRGGPRVAVLGHTERSALDLDRSEPLLGHASPTRSRGGSARHRMAGHGPRLARRLGRLGPERFPSGTEACLKRNVAKTGARTGEVQPGARVTARAPGERSMPRGGLGVSLVPRPSRTDHAAHRSGRP
jgi:hypothetical protein